MLVEVILPLVLAFIMFSLGLGLRGADFARVLQQPRVFAVGLLNQLLLLPLIALVLIKLFSPPPILAVGIIILALCPGGVTSNMLTRIAGGVTPLSISLTAVASLLSVIIVPGVVAWAVTHFGVEGSRPANVTALGVKMFLLTAVPVMLGMLLTKLAPKWGERISNGVSITAFVLFVLIVVLAIQANWSALVRDFATLGPVLLVLMLVMIGLGILSGHLLKITSREATTISLESGIQNATLGMAVASFVGTPSTGGELPDSALPSAVYGVMMYFVVLPFVFWRRKVHGVKD